MHYLIHLARTTIYIIHAYIYGKYKNPLEISIAYLHSTDTKFLFRLYVHQKHNATNLLRIREMNSRNRKNRPKKIGIAEKEQQETSEMVE